MHHHIPGQAQTIGPDTLTLHTSAVTSSLGFFLGMARICNELQAMVGKWLTILAATNYRG
jgi:hypothetical protein